MDSIILIILGICLGGLIFAESEKSLQKVFATGYEAGQLAQESPEPEKAKKACVDFKNRTFSSNCFEALAQK